MNEPSRTSFDQYLGKDPLISFDNAIFSGDSRENKDTWEVLCKSKGSIVFIKVLEDTLKLELLEFANFSEIKYKRLSFIGYAVTFFAIYLSSDFKDLYFISSSFWKTTSLLLAIYFSILLCKSWFEYHKNKNKYSVSQLLVRLKGEE